MAYTDVKIRIFERRGDGYPVEIVLNGEQEFRGALAADILPWVASGDPAQDGCVLFAALFADAALRDAWATAQHPESGRRVRLVIDAPELHVIPWELLRAEGAEMLSAAAATPFSRYLSIAKAWGRPIQARPLRALAVIANPANLEDYNLAPLDAAAERAALEAAFSGLTADVQLDFLDPPASLARIEAALQTGYHLLHYVGHGVFSARRQQAALYMQDDAGLTALVQADALTGMLARQGVQPHLVTLMACQSATRATTDAFRGLGPGLVQAGVPAVVAMQDTVSLPTARLFSETFYRQLGRHGVVDVAMNAARSALLTGERPDAAVPVLFMRLRAGQLWAETIEEPLPIPAPEKVCPDLEELRWFFAEVGQYLTRVEPASLQAEALTQLQTLETTIIGESPNLDTMAAVHTWFSGNAPTLAGKVLNYLILHPTTQALMAYAGEEALAEHRRRFVER